jgi:hypothetical protein
VRLDGRSTRTTKKDRTDFGCGTVANRDDDVDRRRVLRSKFVPAFAAEGVGFDASISQSLQGKRVDSPSGTAASAKRPHVQALAFGQMVEHPLTQYAPRRIMGAKNQNVRLRIVAG